MEKGREDGEGEGGRTKRRGGKMDNNMINCLPLANHCNQSHAFYQYWFTV